MYAVIAAAGERPADIQVLIGSASALAIARQ